MAMAGEGTADLVPFLQEVPLFAGLAPDELRCIASAAMCEAFNEGEYVFREGDEGNRLYIVMSGRMRIQRKAPDGQNVNLAVLKPNQFFGEMALFGQVKRSAGARPTRGDAVLLSLDRERFTEILKSNVNIALHMLACLSQRLRDLNEKVVLVDEAARKHAPTLAETVISEYPHPIALVFQEMDAAADSVVRLKRMLELFEVIVIYQYAQIINAYLHLARPDAELDARLLSGRTGPTLGYRRNTMLSGVEVLQKQKVDDPLVEELCSWYLPRKDRKAILHVLDELINLRNALKHGSEAALDENSCNQLLQRYWPLVQQLVESVAFLGKRPLIHVQGMGFSRGVYKYTYLHCMGAFRRFRTSSFSNPRPLETQLLYVLYEKTGQVLPLDPWMAMLRCQTCGDQDIFMTSAWSPGRLVCNEFTRGHHQSPEDLLERCVDLAVQLEARTRGADVPVATR